MSRPGALVVVVGTATEVGKTWATCRLVERLRSAGSSVAVRKPAQSFDLPGLGDAAPTDAELLGGASGEPPTTVCPPHRWYALAMAPPMAVDQLDLPPIDLDALVAELAWPDHVDVGVVEAAGGVRSPLAHDGDGADLAHRLAVDLVVLVADAGLGTINSVRSSVDALAPLPMVVLLNRYDDGDALHVANRAWLRDRDGLDVVTDVAELAARLVGSARS